MNPNTVELLTVGWCILACIIFMICLCIATNRPGTYEEISRWFGNVFMAFMVLGLGLPFLIRGILIDQLWFYAPLWISAPVCGIFVRLVVLNGK